MTDKPTPTPEQSAILSAVATTNDNLMIRAFAGCGKTATLTMIDDLPPHPKLLLCFNKSIADEARQKVRSTTVVRTFNSLGHKIWAEYTTKKLQLDPKKIAGIFREMVEDLPKGLRSQLWDQYDLITTGVNLARSVGYIPVRHAKADRALCGWNDLAMLLEEHPSIEVWDAIDAILTTSIKQAYNGIIDFPDQCYMPALFGGLYPRFPLVLVDEYQDLSPVNHAMVAKLCRSSRQIGVGDEAQAIYGFRGADADGMSRAISQFSMSVLPLSISFRCPSRIVENVHWRVPEFRAFRDGGKVIQNFSDALPPSATIICRNNAPLLAKAMACLAEGRKIDVSGIDLSTKLIRTLTKLGPEDLTSAQTLLAIDAWEAERIASGSESSKDLAACMRVFAGYGRTLGQAIGYARSLFAQSGTLQFFTGHKSKGLEFDTVFHLDPTLLRETDQDPNLRYVIDTRAKETLAYL